MLIADLLNFYKKELSTISFMKKWLGKLYFYSMIPIVIFFTALAYPLYCHIQLFAFASPITGIIILLFVRNEILIKRKFLERGVGFLASAKPHQLNELKKWLSQNEMNSRLKTDDLISSLRSEKQKKTKFLFSWFTFFLAPFYVLIASYLGGINNHLTLKQLHLTYSLLIFGLIVASTIAYLIKDQIETILFPHDELISLLEEYRLFHFK